MSQVFRVFRVLRVLISHFNVIMSADWALKASLKTSEDSSLADYGFVTECFDSFYLSSVSQLVAGEGFISDCPRALRSLVQ